MKKKVKSDTEALTTGKKKIKIYSSYRKKNNLIRYIELIVLCICIALVLWGITSQA